MTDPTSRVLQLLSLLQTHRFWSGTELAERLEVSERTLRRDVDRLRELGYLVDATPGVAGGYRLAAGNHLPPLLLDDEEAIAISVGLRAASGAAIAGMEDTSLRALAKLEQVLPDRLRRRVRLIQDQTVALTWGADGQTVEPETLAVLAQACRDREQAQFDYVRRDGEESRRLVEPHQLVSAGHRWYLAAWDVRRDDWRTFRLDRMRDARLAGGRFPARELPGGDAAAYVAQSIGSMPKTYCAVLTVLADAPAIEDATRGMRATVTEIEPGRHRVELPGDWLEWLALSVAQLVLTLDVTVEGPPEILEVLGRLHSRLGELPVG